ncbi:PREDICTED: disease resistance [Prunus dulcis]|uniref:PREDICTED: disease resistance n=1 Tax=Prunus dulcis TaxID=3755 RepID=A0A5E4FKR7_PRUDU|nr:PREDICTED: disease resistance [Prunus dulcis]
MEILSGIISKVIEYTVEPVGRQVGYLINYKSNLVSLRSQLKNLNAAKDRMKHRVDEVERNGKGVETDVQNWRTEADEITREAENILGDECQAKTKCFRGVCSNLVSYHQFSRKSTKLAKKIELHAKKEFPSVSYDPPLEEICATPSQNYMAFESRILMVNEIMKELKNPDTNMIGVYGLGGVGKTTLAQEVYRQVNKEEKLFDEVVIIPNVKEKNDMEIQKEIAEKLGMEVKEPQSMAVRANCLWRRIKDKKTLVILDDVLRRIDLEAVGLVPVWTCNLLLTSRDKEVLFSEMGTQKNFQLDLLCEQESLSLFVKRSGAVIKENRIEGVANELAKKCGGLPILVVAVASGLRESSIEVWKDTLRRFKNFEKTGSTEIAFLIIEWSYNKLDSEELKQLFLLCGIMAESNYAFSLSDLLKYTIGLGLFKNVRTVEEAWNALLSLVKKLKDSCLLLDGYDDRSVRMHDVVRDVAVRIASRDQHVLSRAYTELDESLSPSKDCSLISLRRCTIPKLPDVPWECPELKFFHLVSSDNSFEIPCNFFEKMKELKVLDLTRLHFPSLPPSLQSLTNLQTLCLDQCVLGDIALVGQLTNLKILSLIHSQVKELPEEIGQLTRLQLLDLTDCSELVRIPPGVISSLTSLEDLRIGSFKEWEGGLIDGRSNASVSELKQLRQLTALDIHIPDAKLLPANVFSDTRLERYTILVGDCWPSYPRIYGTSSNMLKLKLTTNSQFDRGVKLLLKGCEHLDLDGMEAANIISYLLASDSDKQLKNLHVQNNDEVSLTRVMPSPSWNHYLLTTLLIWELYVAANS